MIPLLVTINPLLLKTKSLECQNKLQEQNLIACMLKSLLFKENDYLYIQHLHLVVQMKQTAAIFVSMSTQFVVNQSHLNWPLLLQQHEYLKKKKKKNCYIVTICTVKLCCNAYIGSTGKCHYNEIGDRSSHIKSGSERGGNISGFFCTSNQGKVEYDIYEVFGYRNNRQNI